MNNKHKAALVAFVCVIFFAFSVLSASISALKAQVEANKTEIQAEIQAEKQTLSTEMQAVKANIEALKESIRAVEDHNGKQGGSLERHHARLKMLEALEASRYRAKIAARRANGKR
jgi:septal ring factor EnvC (AmiA/AmiB activator)